MKLTKLIDKKIWGQEDIFQYVPYNLGYVKIIEAEKSLSVQLHAHKTEIWYFLEKGSMYYGPDRGLTDNQIEIAIKEGNILYYLKKMIFRKGECIVIPPGTIHCLLRDSKVLEISDMRDETFRLYDWDRGRELHVREALNVLRGLKIVKEV